MNFIGRHDHLGGYRKVFNGVNYEFPKVVAGHQGKHHWFWRRKVGSLFCFFFFKDKCFKSFETLFLLLLRKRLTFEENKKNSG